MIQSKPSRRVERQASRKRPPQNVRLGVFLSAEDADQLDREAESNQMSVSNYLRILISSGRQALLAEAEARAAEAEALRLQPQEEAAQRKAQEAKLLSERDRAQTAAICRSTIHGRTT